MSRAVKEDIKKFCGRDKNKLNAKPRGRVIDETEEIVLKKRGGKIEKRRYDHDDEFWIQDAVKKPGALHRALHVPEGKKIPAKKLTKAEHSKSPLMRKRANFAATMKKISRHHDGD